jgi:radical SAM superfamily enzyme YgiQ (UPF0313 family)
MKVLFVYPRFERHSDSHPELRAAVPMQEYLGSPSLGIAMLAAVTPPGWEIEYRDDRLEPADLRPTDADLVALSFFTPAASRAIELAAHYRAAGRKVVAGGIFASLIPEEAEPHFDAIVLGEGEVVWPQLLADAAAGQLRRRYQSLEAVDLRSLPLPAVELYLARESAAFRPDDYPVQISRGCPMSCHACALPTSMTTSMREFPLEHVIGQLQQLGRAGRLACLTEDTSWFPGRARSRLGELFDLMATRPDIARISYIGISMPMILTTPVSFFHRARAAGVSMFYLVGGFDPITMRAFTGRDPRALARAHEAIARTHDLGIEPYTSFLLGLDDDDAGTVDRILEFCQKSRIRKAEFAVFTPYPGTPSWRRLLAEDRILHRRWSKYNDANVVFRPAQMTPDELQAGYIRLWSEFYAERGHLRDLPQVERTIQF